MAVRPFPLGDKVDGINLMRNKGGASPSSLFDLKNGWITSKRTIKARPGSAAHLTFPAGTKGCVGFEGKFHTFSHAAVAGTVDSRVVVNIIKHPSGGAATLSKVHRAFPFLGRLYVVAEFSDGVVQHYWIEKPKAWVGATVYPYASIVQPTTPNGFYYEVLTRDTTPAWQANVVVAAGDKRQPRTINGFRYVVASVGGVAPIRTGNTEPEWPTKDGETVTERRFVTVPQVPPGTPTSEPDSGSGGTGSGGGSDDEYNYNNVQKV